MKNNIVVLVVIVVIGALSAAAYFKINGKPAEQQTYKIGMLYQGASFEQVAAGFKAGLDAIIPPGKKVEYLVKQVTGIEQKDFDATAQELVDAKVDLIFAVALEPVIAAKKVTEKNQIPVVLALGGNPVIFGAVKSLQSSGNNLTGMTWLAWELSGKRLELLKKLDPTIKRVLVLGKKGSKAMNISLEFMKPTAESLGITIITKEIADFKDLEKEVGAISRKDTDAIYYAPDPFISRNSKFIISQSLDKKLPTIFADEYFVKQGALASYGGNFESSGKQASRLAGKILFNHERPQTLPIENVAKIDFIINLASAEKIGLKLSPEVLDLAASTVK